MLKPMGSVIPEYLRKQVLSQRSLPSEVENSGGWSEEELSVENIWLTVAEVNTFDDT